MAKVIVDSAEVVRIHKNGGGFVAQQTKQLGDGITKVEKFTVWTTQPVEVGATVSFHGVLSVRVEEFTNDEGLLIRYASIHVNDPVLGSISHSKDLDGDAPF